MRPPRRRDASGRTLIITFAAVAVSFTLATVIAQAANLRIRSAARDITGNASPTVARLSSMRGTIRRLEVAVHEAIEHCELQSCGPMPAAVDQLERSLWKDWLAYQKLPAFPGETDSWPSIDRDLRSIQENLTGIFGSLARAQSGEAATIFLGRTEPTIEQLDEAISRLVQSDSDHEAELASKIDSLALHSIVFSIALDLASIALTIVAAALAISLVRRHERGLQARAEELDLFAGRVAHDVSSPLWAASAALNVAHRSADEQGREALALAQSSVGLVQRLVKGLLEFARSGAAPAAGLSEDLVHVIESVAKQMRPEAESNDVELRVEPSIDGCVACPTGILESIVANLAGNAIKHIGKGSVRRVVIRTDRAEAAGAVRLEVEDTGPGISPEFGERAFEPFVRGSTTGPAGFGLGLATVKRLVTAYRGLIGFNSHPGRGTLFWVELPVARTWPVRFPSGFSGRRPTAPCSPLADAERRGSAV